MSLFLCSIGWVVRVLVDRKVHSSFSRECYAGFALTCVDGAATTTAPAVAAELVSAPALWFCRAVAGATATSSPPPAPARAAPTEVTPSLAAAAARAFSARPEARSFANSSLLASFCCCFSSLALRFWSLLLRNTFVARPGFEMSRPLPVPCLASESSAVVFCSPPAPAPVPALL